MCAHARVTIYRKSNSKTRTVISSCKCQKRIIEILPKLRSGRMSLGDCLRRDYSRNHTLCTLHRTLRSCCISAVRGVTYVFQTHVFVSSAGLHQREEVQCAKNNAALKRTDVS